MLLPQSSWKQTNYRVLFLPVLMLKSQVFDVFLNNSWALFLLTSSRCSHLVYGGLGRTFHERGSCVFVFVSPRALLIHSMGSEY